MAIANTKKSPMAKLRSKLFVACRQQEQHAPNIWLVYSARKNREWVLRSDLQYLHFLDIEFDPDVRRFDLAPAPQVISLGGTTETIEFDAIVEFRDGHTECREIRAHNSEDEAEDDFSVGRLHVAAEKRHARYVRISEETLEPNRQRIQNTLRMLRFLSAARSASLVDAHNAVLICLATHRSGLPLHELAARITDAPEALVYAAIFQLLQRGRVTMDIGGAPLTGMTNVRVVS